jgi:hypothetical protein
VDVDGSVRLCAAAAIALAGLGHFYGPEAAREFEQELTCSRNSVTLDQAFAKLALPQQLCDAVKIYNDSVIGDTRREAVIEYLERLPQLT